MQLAVSHFFNFKPASQWAFALNFSDIRMLAKLANGYITADDAGLLTHDDLIRLSNAVVSTTQPKYTIETDIKHYGNFNFVIPKYDSTNMSFTITFEETDDCLISHKFINGLMGGIANYSIPVWLNTRPYILIRISRYNSYVADLPKLNAYLDNGVIIPTYHNKNLNSVSLDEDYLCQLSEYTEPSYNRSGMTQGAATCTVTFIATKLASSVDDSAVQIYKPSAITVENVWDQLVASANKFYNTASQIPHAVTTFVGKITQPPAKTYKSAGGTNDAAKAALDTWRTSGTPTNISYSRFEFAGKDRTKIINLTAAAMMKVNSTLDENTALNYASKLYDTVKKNDVSLSLAFAIMQQESGFNTASTSGTGAGGLMQLTKSAIHAIMNNGNVTAKQYATQMAANTALRYNPMMNIEVAVNYISYARSALSSSIYLPKLNSLEGLMGAYNAGNSGMNSYLRTGEWKTGQKQYTFRVLR